MYNILNIAFNEKTKLRQALCSIFGIGKQRSEALCGKLGYNKNVMLKDFTQDEIEKIIKKLLYKKIVGKDLEREIFFKVKLKQDVKVYQGIRYRMGLPVRGQRTKTNSRTVRRLLNRKI